MSSAGIERVAWAWALLCAGCSDAPAWDAPAEVRVQRIIALDGSRVVSYTAMYADGIETYVDLSPAGSVDLVTVEREGIEGGAARRFVRAGVSVAEPADGPAGEPLTGAWEERFALIVGLVDAERVPWSDAHGLVTPGEGG